MWVGGWLVVGLYSEVMEFYQGVRFLYYHDQNELLQFDEETVELVPRLGMERYPRHEKWSWCKGLNYLSAEWQACCDLVLYLFEGTKVALLFDSIGSVSPDSHAARGVALGGKNGDEVLTIIRESVSTKDISCYPDTDMYRTFVPDFYGKSPTENE